MNEAHVFQEKYTGVQIFVYHCMNEFEARVKFYPIVIDEDNWQYIGKKIAENV